MNKDFISKSKKINKYLKILKRVADFKTMIAEDIYTLYQPKKYNLVSGNNNNNYNELKNTKILMKNEIDSLAEEYIALSDEYEKEKDEIKNEKSWIKYYKLSEITDKLKDKLEKHTTINIPDKHYEEWFKYYEIFIKYKHLIGKTKKTIKGLHLCEPTMVSVNALRYYNFIHNKNLISYDWFIQNIDCRECNKSIYNKFHNKFVLKNFKNKNVIESLCNKVKDDKFKLIVSNCSEKENIKKLFILIFSLLEEYGSCVIKYRYPVLYKNLDLLELCYKHFVKISFYKPVYSNSTEFFIICQKYTPINNTILTELKKDTYKPKFSNHFKANIKRAILGITNDVIFEISKGIFYLRNSEDLPTQNDNFIKKVINKKLDQWFRLFMPINMKSRKKKSFLDITLFADLFKINNSLTLDLSKKNSNNNSKNSLDNYFKNLRELNKIINDEDKYPKDFFQIFNEKFNVIYDEKFKLIMKKHYGFTITNNDINMNEILVSFKDLLPKKSNINVLDICKNNDNSLKMINYYVKNILKGKITQNSEIIDLIICECGDSKLILNNISGIENCIIKFNLIDLDKETIKIMNKLNNIFENIYLYKSNINFDSNEFYIIFIGKENNRKNSSNKNSQSKIHNNLKNIIRKRNEQLENVIYLMNITYYNLLTEKDLDKIEKLKEKNITDWLKINKL